MFTRREFTIGKTIVMSFERLDPVTGEPEDATGWTGTLSILSDYGGTVLASASISLTDPTRGQFEFVIPAATSEGLTDAVKLFTVDVVKADGRAYRLEWGLLFPEPQVTP